MHRFCDELWRHLAQSPGAQRLGSALLHFLWEGVLVAAIAWVLLVLMRRARPQVRYALLLTLFAAMVACPVVTFLVVDAPSPNAAVLEAQMTGDSDPALPPVRAISIEPDSVPAISFEPLFAPQPAAADPTEVAASVPLAEPAPRQAGRWRETWTAARDWLAHRRHWVVIAWLVGVCLLSVRLGLGLWGAEQARRRGVRDVAGPLQQVGAALAHCLGIRYPVRIVESALAEVPTLVGWLRPMILLPATAITGLTASQLEAILAHELAHVRRHDYLVNLCQTVVETILFYHPAVWWLSRRIRHEREHCCDDVAVALCHDRAGYARALAAMEELRSLPSSWAVAARGGSLLARVRRLMGRPEPATAGGRPALAVVALVLTLVVLASVRLPNAKSDASSTGAAGSASADETFSTSATELAAGDAPPEPAKPVDPVKRERDELVANDKANDKESGPAESRQIPAAAGKQAAWVISGRVVDENGKGIAGAGLCSDVRSSVNPAQERVVDATSDSQGRFRLEAPLHWKTAPYRTSLVWALGEGTSLTVVRAEVGSGRNGNNPELLIRLEPSTDTSFHVVDPDGVPIVGASVEPWTFHAPNGISEVVPGPLRDRLRGTTNEAGAIRMPAMRRNVFDSVRVTTKAFGTQELRLDGPESIEADRTIALRSTGTIEGRVIADSPTELRGVELWLRTEKISLKHIPMRPDRPFPARFARETEGQARVVTDDNGRFVVPKIAEGRLTFWSRSPHDSRMLPALPDSLDVVPRQRIEVYIPLHQAVTVRGTILTEDTQKPVGGAEISVRNLGQSHLGIGRVTSDADGRFETRVLPGAVSRQVIFYPDAFPGHRQLREAREELVNVPGGHSEFELPPILLTPTVKIAGTVLDDLAKPVADALVVALEGDRSLGAAETDWQGRFFVHLSKMSAADRFQVGRRVEPAPRPAMIRSRDPLVLVIRNQSESVAEAAQLSHKSKTDLKRTAPDAQGRFTLVFHNPLTDQDAHRWRLDPAKHQVVFQLFVKDAEGNLLDKIFRQLPARSLGGYRVNVQAPPELIEHSSVSVTFVTIQPEHDQWVQAFFHEGKGTKYSGIWSGDGGKLLSVPVVESLTGWLPDRQEEEPAANANKPPPLSRAGAPHDRPESEPVALAQAKAPEASAFPKRRVAAAKLTGEGRTLAHDDGKSAGKLSIAGSAHAVRFRADNASSYLTSVEIYGSRYGTPAPPKESFRVWLCDEDFKPIAQFDFPYSKFERGEPKWVKLPIEPTKAPKEFILCVSFNPAATKGVYVHHDAEGGEQSLTGLPGDRPKPFAKGDWLIRAHVDQLKEADAPSP
ncbi:MAG: M56 family metallopeptidase [Planctomycetaceae bacterium]